MMKYLSILMLHLHTIAVQWLLCEIQLMYMSYQELILLQSSGNFLFVYLLYIYIYIYIYISGNSMNNPEHTESVT